MNYFADFLFPPACLLCRKPGELLCGRCQPKLPLAKNQICPVCASPSVSGITHLSCLRKTSLNGLFSPFAYRKETKKLLLSLKFKMVKSLAATMADLLAAKLKQNQLLVSFWQEKNFILVPLPLHPIREKWRGFNQSLLIGQRLAQSLKLEWKTDLLTRAVLASPQVGLGKKERRKNIKNQFRAGQEASKKSFIILDDVWTSGATLKEAGKKLKEKGAKSVWGLTFCR